MTPYQSRDAFEKWAAKRTLEHLSSPWQISFGTFHAGWQARGAAEREAVLEEAAQLAEHPEQSSFVQSWKEAWSSEEGKRVAAAIRALKAPAAKGGLTVRHY